MPYSNRCFILHSMIPLATGTIWKNKLTMSLFKLCFRHRIERRVSGDKSSTQRLCRLCVCVNRAGVSHSSMFLYSKHVVATKKNNIRNKTKNLWQLKIHSVPRYYNDIHTVNVWPCLWKAPASRSMSLTAYTKKWLICAFFLRFIFTLLQLIS